MSWSDWAPPLPLGNFTRTTAAAAHLPPAITLDKVKGYAPASRATRETDSPAVAASTG